MTKPEDIPQDVWDAARSAWVAAYAMRRVGPANTFMPIASAIMAERRRCVAIASPLPLQDDDSDIEKQSHDIRLYITEQIQAGNRFPSGTTSPHQPA